jgi:hypothetical protein
VEIARDLGTMSQLNFSLAFVTKQKEVDTLCEGDHKKAEGDAVTWFAHPKGISKNYKSKIDRDSAWAAKKSPEPPH